MQTAFAAAVPLDHAARVILGEVDARWQRGFGRASQKALVNAAIATLKGERVNAATLHARCARIEQEHVARYGRRALEAELTDEAKRDAATRSDIALVAYQAKWSQRLRRLQLAQPKRWSVRGLSAEELHAELTLALIELIMEGQEQFERYERAGREFGFSFMASARSSMRRKYRLRVVLTEAELTFDPEPTHEERLIEDELQSAVRLASATAERSLSRPQRRWLSAMKLSAHVGGFFESSGRLNLASASRLLGKNRSSAQRAFSEIRRHFQAEFDKRAR